MWKRLLLIALVYQLLRIIFFTFNYEYYQSLNISTILHCFWGGIRFDAVSITIINAWFIIAHFIMPKKLFQSNKIQYILKLFYNFINSIFILINLVDVGFYNFTGKRSTADLLQVLSGGNDLLRTAPSFILSHWYLLLIFFLILWLINSCYPKITPIELPQKKKVTLLYWISSLVLVTILLRGGLQLKPIGLLVAGNYGNGNQSALVLNSSFSMIKTWNKEQLKQLNYMSLAEANKYAPLLNEPTSEEKLRMVNIVFIVLESFGKEYSQKLTGGPSYTPFLDSLMEHSLVCTRAYANGKKSIEGIPAILSSLPALMTEPIITSAYNGNTLPGLPKLLKRVGYTTAFFHGGNNGTMGFDNYSKAIGFDHYYGKDEYNNTNDDDG
ncbi:MAG: hypothetical protein RIQ89_2073, partial [Bacteroidota bacterium]